jgi:hypothetical protein
MKNEADGFSKWIRGEEKRRESRIGREKRLGE